MQAKTKPLIEPFYKLFIQTALSLLFRNRQSKIIKKKLKETNIDILKL